MVGGAEIRFVPTLELLDCRPGNFYFVYMRMRGRSGRLRRGATWGRGPLLAPAVNHV